MYKPETYLSIEECKIGTVYKLRSRNLFYGVYTKDNSFIGIRSKFGDRYLATEYHYDNGAPYGTAFPIQEIGIVPNNILLLDRLGSFDLNTKRQVEFDKPISDGGKGWYYVDTGESNKNIRACTKHNDALFEYLDSIKLEG